MEALLPRWSWAIAAGAGYVGFLVLVLLFFMSSARARRVWDAWSDDQVRTHRHGRREREWSGRVSGLLLVVLVAATVRQPDPAQATPADDRPNVLVIVTDDQTRASFTRDLMPNVFAELVDQGVRFNRAYVATPLCCPSRAQILTGLHEHHSGVDGNGVPLERPTIVAALDEIGYRTSLAGKYLNSWPCEPRPEFDQWVCAAGGRSSYSLMDPTLNVNGEWVSFDGYTTDILADYTASFISNTPEGQSFFALYAPTSPHFPANDDRCYDVPVEPHRPPSYDEDTRASGKPLYQQRGPLSSSEIESMDSAHAIMTRAVPCLDGSIQTILSSLGSRAHDTLVFFLSDNGYLFGEHRRSSKGVAYDESARVPFVVRYPALVPTAQKFISKALVQNIDIPATIADVLGIKWGADGISMVPLLTRTATSIRDGGLLQFCQGATYPCEPPILPFSESSPPSYKAVVTTTMKYIENVTGEKELYDLVADPDEMWNVAGEPGYADVEADLVDRLSDLRASPSPETTIVTGLRGEIHSRLPLFTYFSQSRFARYECRLTKDGVVGSWRSCDQGTTVEGPLQDGNYVFEVVATDENDQRDGTPDNRSFSIRSTGPDVRIDSGPPPHGRDRSVSFSFSSQTPGVAFECRLIPYGQPGAWESCDPSTGAAYGPLDDGRWNFQVRAVDPLGAASDPPAEWFVRVDNAGPLMRFLQAPADHTRSNVAVLKFRPDETVPGGLTCRLDDRSPEDCTAGTFEAREMGTGSHTLSIDGTDELDNAATTKFKWTIDQTPPSLTVDGPPPFTSDGDATIRLEATEPLDSKDPFPCAFDGANRVLWNHLKSACEAEVLFSDLSDGLHTLDVVANDRAGNVSDVVTWTWTVDTEAPVATITGGPADPTTETRATFHFSIADLTPVKLRCTLDGGKARQCRSGVTYEGLISGPHTFSVVPKDSAGNVGQAAVWTWNIVP